jgi:hypothetical protein
MEKRKWKSENRLAIFNFPFSNFRCPQARMLAFGAPHTRMESAMRPMKTMKKAAKISRPEAAFSNLAFEIRNHRKLLKTKNRTRF